MRRKVNPWLAGVLEAFDAAKARWENDAENASLGYATELEMFEHDNPKPQLRDFLRAMGTAEAKRTATH